MKTVGSRAEVWHGTAEHTTGGLKKGDLYMGKDGHLHSTEMKKRGKSPALKKWRAAVKKATKEMEKSGDLKKGEFHTPKKGTPLYTLSKKYYKP